MCVFVSDMLFLNLLNFANDLAWIARFTRPVLPCEVHMIHICSPSQQAKQIRRARGVEVIDKVTGEKRGGGGEIMTQTGTEVDANFFPSQKSVVTLRRDRSQPAKSRQHTHKHCLQTDPPPLPTSIFIAVMIIQREREHQTEESVLS